MENIKLKNLVNAFLNKACQYKYPLEANYYSPLTYVTVASMDGDKCYSSQRTKYNFTVPVYHIVLGNVFYSSLRGVKVSSSIPVDKQSIIYGDINTVYEAVFYHELGHVLYTPMLLSKKVAEELEGQRATNFLSLFMTVMNLVEDVVIEGEILYNRPDLKRSLHHLRRLAFSDVPEEITPDISGTINTLLHNFRTISDEKVSYPDANVHKFLTTYMYVCINTPDPVERLYRVLAFSAALWDVFNCKETPHYKHYKIGLGKSFYSNIPDKYKDKEGDNTTQPNPKDNYFDSARGYSIDNNPSPSSQPTNTPSSDEEVSNEYKESLVEHRNEGFSSGPIGTLPPNSALDERQIISDAHEDVECNMHSHCFLEVSKLYDSSSLINRYNDVTSKYSLMINQISDIIKKRKLWNNTHWEGGHTSGKLNDKSFYKNTHKIYKQRGLPKKEADLVFSILIDNSGSMSGIKTHLCGEALIVLSEVCNKLRIPFEINAFTENNVAYTLGLKSFKDNYNKVKTNLSMIEQQIQVPSLFMYGGNIDEINLNFVWQGFRKRKEKDKIIIVISDGQTCGSVGVLSRLVKSIEKDNIKILGLGIKTKEVDKIYPHHKTFHSEEDLKELPKFLNDYLVKNIFIEEEK